MQTQLNKILQEAKEQIKKASSLAETEEIRVKILGKKGALTAVSYTHLTLPTKRIV